MEGKKQDYWVNEKEEFQSILNYKNLKFFKSDHYIYIGQIKNYEQISQKEKGKEGRKDEQRKIGSNEKDVPKKLELIEKSEKKKKKESHFIKEGYGVLLDLQNTKNGETRLINKFFGCWKNDKREGVGFQIFQNNSIYYGNYEQNERNGFGFFKWNNGDTLEGYWKCNEITSNGIYKNSNFSYEGEFYDNKFIKYNGDWVDLFCLEKKKKKKENLDKVCVMVVPFSFIEKRLRIVSEEVRNHYHRIPFLLCSRAFKEKNHLFNLSKFVLWSYYKDIVLPTGTKGNFVYFDKNPENTKSGLKETERIITSEKIITTESNSLQSSNVEESIDSNKSECGSSIRNSSKHSEDLEDAMMINSCGSSSSNVTENIYVTEVKREMNSKEELDLYMEIKKHSKENTSSDASSLSKFISHEETGSNTSKQNQEEYTEESRELCILKEEKRKNELHNLFQMFMNSYIDSDESCSNYSCSSQKSDIEKETVEDFVDPVDISNIVNENDNNCINYENKEVVLEKHELSEEALLLSIEEELCKLQITITFLEKMNYLGLSYEYDIKKKIQNSMQSGYPFIFYLNKNECVHKYNSTNSDMMIVGNVKIPDSWNLSIYFNKEVHTELERMSPVSSTTKIDQRQDKEMDIVKDNSTNLTTSFNSEFLTCDLGSLNIYLRTCTFIITDLLIDDFSNEAEMKRILGEQFKNHLNLNHFMFIVII